MGNSQNKQSSPCKIKVTLLILHFVHLKEKKRRWFKPNISLGRMVPTFSGKPVPWDVIIFPVKTEKELLFADHEQVNFS